jgi:hypothetical protein
MRLRAVLGLLYPHGVRVDQAALVTMFPADLWQTVWNHMA